MLRDNAGRARQAIVIFYCIAGLALGAAVLDLLHISFFDYGAEESLSLNTWLELGQGLVGLLQFVLLVTGFIVLIRWLRRAYVNLQLAGLNTEYSDGWAAGAWFVPFINLVRPYSIVREVWRGTQLKATGHVQSHELLRVWWLAALFDNGLGYIAGKVALSAESMQQLKSAVWLSFFSNLLGIGAAILTAHMIQRVAGFEENLQLQRQVEELGRSAPEPVEHLPSNLAEEPYF